MHAWCRMDITQAAAHYECTGELPLTTGLLSPRVLTTDDEGPGLTAARVDHLRHLYLLLGLRLGPDHLDAPRGARSNHHLAPARCLLPHCGPLSDLASLRPRPLLH